MIDQNRFLEQLVRPLDDRILKAARAYVRRWARTHPDGEAAVLDALALTDVK
jgi:hypothetical protein